MTIDVQRNPERAIPAVTVPDLAELGLDEDLRATGWTRAVFACRPLLGAAGIVALWLQGWWLPALALIPAIYGWSLTTVHHLIHRSLGFGPRCREILLTAVSLLLLESGHALERTHLCHHRTDPTAPDPEGYIESLGWGRLFGEAPLFRYRLWWWAARNPQAVETLAATERSDRRRRIEVAWHAAWSVFALVLAIHGMFVGGLGRTAALVVVYVGAQHLANAVFAVMAARGPHAYWGRTPPSPLIAVRGALARFLLFGHVWHLEHHLYPEIPLPHLVVVAERIEPLLIERGAVVVKTL